MNERTAFVAGWPIAHSRSPLIHNFWLKRYGVQGEYRREAVAPESAADFFRTFRSRGFVGGNVTIPHKETAHAACDRLTPLAAHLGAVNTLWHENGLIHGDNTDPAGFAANLDEREPSWSSRRSALVIGSGGAAKGVVAALLDRNYTNISVVNRTAERASDLARMFGSRVRAGALGDLGSSLPSAELVVNATSSGMNGSAALPVNWTLARPDTLVTDLVYVPLMTPFLAGAAAAGLQTVDGLGMLLHQAVPGFERWFGVRPTVDAALRQHVLADLGH